MSYERAETTLLVPVGVILTVGTFFSGIALFVGAPLINMEEVTPLIFVQAIGLYFLLCWIGIEIFLNVVVHSRHITFMFRLIYLMTRHFYIEQTPNEDIRATKVYVSGESAPHITIIDYKKPNLDMGIHYERLYYSMDLKEISTIFVLLLSFIVKILLRRVEANSEVFR